MSTPDESRAVVNAAYAAGAVRVLAVAIHEYPDEGAANTGKLVVELPADPALRAEVFGWASEIARSQGFDPEPDAGQPYLFVSLD